MYKDVIQTLIEETPLEIDTQLRIQGRPPTMASSEFLTNKEQGDWAEQVILKALNDFSGEYFAVKYGHSDAMAAGDEGFADFYIAYQEELNNIGKKPDILIYKTSDFPHKTININDDKHIQKAIAALEVRSSSFLLEKYSALICYERIR